MKWRKRHEPLELKKNPSTLEIRKNAASLNQAPNVTTKQWNEQNPSETIAEKCPNARGCHCEQHCLHHFIPVLREPSMDDERDTYPGEQCAQHGKAHRKRANDSVLPFQCHQRGKFQHATLPFVERRQFGNC